MTIVTDLCLAMRSDLLGVIRGLWEVVTCIYGLALTCAFSDPLIAAYRLSVIHVSLISVLDGPDLNWCEQEHLRTQMIEMVLFGKINDPKLMVLNFIGQLQCRMGEYRQGPFEAYRNIPNTWILNPLEWQAGEILQIPSWTETFELIRRELSLVLEFQTSNRVSRVFFCHEN